MRRKYEFKINQKYGAARTISKVAGERVSPGPGTWIDPNYPKCGRDAHL